MINTILLHIDILDQIWHIIHFIFNIIIGIVAIIGVIFIPNFLGKIITNDSLYDPFFEWVVGVFIIFIFYIFIYGCWYYA